MADMRARSPVAQSTASRTYSAIAISAARRLRLTVPSSETARAAKGGFAAIGARNRASGLFCARARESIVELAAAGDLKVPLARTFALEDARDAAAMLAGPRPGGKLALVPGA